MQGMAGLWGKVWSRTPPRRVLGSVLTSELCPGNPQAGGAGPTRPRGTSCVAFAGPCPFGIRFCPTVLVACSGRACSQGPEMATTGVTPGRGINCDVWGRTPRGLEGEGGERRAGERVTGELGREAEPQLPPCTRVLHSLVTSGGPAPLPPTGSWSLSHQLPVRETKKRRPSPPDPLPVPAPVCAGRESTAFCLQCCRHRGENGSTKDRE